MTISEEDRTALASIGVTLPAATRARGSATLSRTIDAEDLEQFELRCPCPHCKTAIVFDEESRGSTVDCPSCHATINITWGSVVTDIEVSVALSPQLTDADRKYLQWRKERAA
jgi:ribosomal protein S27E